MQEQQILAQFRQKISEDLKDLQTSPSVPLFYDPIDYINALPGKKLRPILTLVSGLAVGGQEKNLLAPASAIELLHNFSLVHDDIMDNDETRRGKPTVHVKWDLGTAILAGDGLLGLAYRKLLQTPNINDLRLTVKFTEAMIEICEGQALDKTFETEDTVSEPAYLEMISKKTATLIKLACEIGGIVGEGNTAEITALAEFGYNIGMGFQIQDDLLDILADETVLGKKVGSDLQMNKKTIISIKLREQAATALAQIDSIKKYRDVLAAHHIITDVENMVAEYFTRANYQLSLLPKNQYTRLLAYLVTYIQKRDK